MARLRRSESVQADDSSILPTTSQSPSPSQNSDKENGSRQRKENQRMGPPPLPQAHHASATKKRKFGEQGSNLTNGTSNNLTNGINHAPTQQPRADSEAPVYDPYQDVQERQKIRKGLRDLSTQVLDNRTEWLEPDDKNLHETNKRANVLFRDVKQTSDATIDSRLLVTIGDLAYKKTQKASLGDGSQGVDVDDFVTKCIAFMMAGDDSAETHGGAITNGTTPRSQRRRNHRQRVEVESDNEVEEEDSAARGDAYNWTWLGSRACFGVTCRPPAPSFLLGPLSVQKRARAPIQRRARQEKFDAATAVKPVELHMEDLHRQEDSSLTSMCIKIRHQLASLQVEVFQAEEAGEDSEEWNRLFEKPHFMDDLGVSLFHFAFNPRSFGQTVENLFYVSFLIKEGRVGVEISPSGEPSLHYIHRNDDNPNAEDNPDSGTKFQSVLGIDFADWEAVCETFDVKESLIKHRNENQEDVVMNKEVGRSAWYG